MYKIANFKMRVQVPLLSSKVFSLMVKQHAHNVQECWFDSGKTYLMYIISFMVFITPLKKKVNKLSPLDSIVYCDFETVVFNNKHYVTCFSFIPANSNSNIVKSISNINSNNIEELSENLISVYIQLCIDFANRSSLNKSFFIFHNLGKFDSLFILNYFTKYFSNNIQIITRDNIIYEMVLAYNNKKIIFRDSYLLFPVSLDKMSQLFNLNVSKNLNWNYLTTLQDYHSSEFIYLLENYCLNDTYILKEGFNLYIKLIFEKFKINLLDNLTLSSLSLKIFRLYYYDFYNTPIENLNNNFDIFIRKAFKGGVVEVYKPYLSNGYHYDINSLYPYVMSVNDMPINSPKFIEIDDNFNIDSFFGFIEVEVETPTDLYIPFLVHTDKTGKLISPLGKWKDTYFSEEVKYAIKLGYKFKYLKAVEFKRGKVFSNFVNSLYNERINQKDIGISNIIKLLLNSLYGRLGMHNNNFSSEIINNDKETINNKFFLKQIKTINYLYEKIIYNFKKIVDYNFIIRSYLSKNISSLNLNKVLNQKLMSQKPFNTAVQISAAVTSYGRIEMYKYKVLKDINVYYTDTDSIYTDKPLPSHLVDNINLGFMRYENSIKEAYFIAPKLYYILTTENIEKCVGKGIEKNILTKFDYINLYNNNLITLNSKFNFFRNIKTYTITTFILEKTISGISTKRDKVFDKTGKWINTKPIKI